MPPPVVGAADPRKSLALRNLERGRQFGLPSGQAVADAMNVVALKDDQIQIGQDVDGAALKGIVEVTGVQKFAGNCPLWTYILAEAMCYRENPPRNAPVNPARPIGTPQLGPVGGRIVAEVFLGLLSADKQSYLCRDPAWTPEGQPDFGLKHFVMQALQAP